MSDFHFPAFVTGGLRHLLRVPVAALVGGLLFAADASAQITGTVVGEAEGPVAGAMVELWVGSRAVERERTDGSGSFTLTADHPGTSSGALLVAAPGYRSRRLAVEEHAAERAIELARIVHPLAAVDVDALPPCPVKPDPTARERWERAASRFTAPRPGVRVGSDMVRRSGTGDYLDAYDPPAGGGGRGMRGSVTDAWLGWERRIEREGYAWPISVSSFDGAYESWEFPPLDGEYAAHFVAPSFGRLHDFFFVGESDGAADDQIGFCPKKRGEGLRGRVLLSAHGSIAEVEWLFPKDDAGGVAFFAPPAEAEPVYLLPIQAIYWRKLRTGEYFHRSSRYTEWVVEARGR